MKGLPVCGVGVARAALVLVTLTQVVAAEEKHGQGVECGPFVPEGYSLVWQEEFDGPDLDLSKWGFRSEGKSSDGSGRSILTRDGVSVNGSGCLRLSTGERDGTLQTCMVSTNDKFEPLYGYFESRIRFQRQQGHHGAFWLKPRSFGRYPGDPGRSGAEVDIIEFFGSGRSDGGLGLNIYWVGSDGTNERIKGEAEIGSILAATAGEDGTHAKELCDDFHVFGLEWTPRLYTFFIDGHEVFSTGDGMSHQPQPIILSLLSHDWETDKLDRAKLDDDMLVDYVRVYQKIQRDVSMREQTHE